MEIIQTIILYIWYIYVQMIYAMYNENMKDWWNARECMILLKQSMNLLWYREAIWHCWSGSEPTKVKRDYISSNVIIFGDM